MNYALQIINLILIFLIGLLLLHQPTFNQEETNIPEYILFQIEKAYITTTSKKFILTTTTLKKEK